MIESLEVGLHVFMVIGSSMFIMGIGLIQAFWPVNDEPVKHSHSAVWLLLTALALYFVEGFFIGEIIEMVS